MADTKDFDSIRIGRSDGADTGPGYWPSPTPAPAIKKIAKEPSATDKAPRAKAHMVRLAEDDPRFVEWRIKLGILLKQELSPNPEEGNPWYVQFPRGYWLYEKSKHLLVSGYPIKSKLFKSPQEFGLHLIWLLSASNEYKDCCCVNCNASTFTQLSAALEEALVIAPPETGGKGEKQAAKVTPVPLPPLPGQTMGKPADAGQAQSALTPPVAATPPLSTASPAPVSQAQVPRSQPQFINWSLQSPLLFRSGEMVWYENGQTWRLGVVSQLDGTNHELLPLGYASISLPKVSKTSDKMRPFHAFSVPPVAIPDLKDKVFDDIPWEAMFNSTGNDNAKRDFLALDASKMASAKIDYSFSMWSFLNEDQNSNAMTYYGCFLGAERVELGDCLRVKSLPADLNVRSENAVLAVRYIFTPRDNPNIVLLRGQLYQASHLDASSPTIIPPEHLPVALRDETQWRAQTNPSYRLRWTLIQEDIVLKETSIRGRFYPRQRLMPILNLKGYQDAVAQGRVDDLHAHLNNRMEAVGGRYAGRRWNRLDSIGAAVATGSGIVFERHVREEAYQM